MSIKIQSDLQEGLDNSEVKRFLGVLKKASLQLNTLGQIQSAVGGLSMSSLAGETFETIAMLDNYIGQIEYNLKQQPGPR